MNIKEKILETCKILDEVDNYIGNLANELSNVDQKICDLMHYIEYNKLKTNQCYRIVKELHSLRIERRKIKNDMEIAKVFNQHQNKLLQQDNRKLLMSFIGKTEKDLLTSKYNNRSYTEEGLAELIG